MNRVRRLFRRNAPPVSVIDRPELAVESHEPSPSGSLEDVTIPRWRDQTAASARHTVPAFPEVRKSDVRAVRTLTLEGTTDIGLRRLSLSKDVADRTLEGPPMMAMMLPSQASFTFGMLRFSDEGRREDWMPDDVQFSEERRDDDVIRDDLRLSEERRRDYIHDDLRLSEERRSDYIHDNQPSLEERRSDHVHEKSRLSGERIDDVLMRDDLREQDLKRKSLRQEELPKADVIDEILYEEDENDLKEDNTEKIDYQRASKAFHYVPLHHGSKAKREPTQEEIKRRQELIRMSEDIANRNMAGPPVFATTLPSAESLAVGVLAFAEDVADRNIKDQHPHDTSPPEPAPKPVDDGNLRRLATSPHSSGEFYLSVWGQDRYNG